jgi:hypothetical protein
MQPIVTSYLSSVLVPTAGKDLSMRNAGELRHLAEALDMLLTGNMLGAADVLAQRFRSVETAHFDGNWQRAKHLEIVGDSRVSSVDVKEHQRLSRMAREDVKMRNTSEGTGRGEREGPMVRSSLRPAPSDGDRDRRSPGRSTTPPPRGPTPPRKGVRRVTLVPGAAVRDFDREAPVVPEKVKGADEAKEDDWKNQWADRGQQLSKRKDRRKSWWKGTFSKSTTKKWAPKRW